MRIVPGVSLLIDVTRIANLAPSDSRSRMDVLTKIRKLLGLDEGASEEMVVEVLEERLGSGLVDTLREKLGVEEADEAKLLEALDAKLRSGDESLEDRARREGKRVISDKDFAQLTEQAAQGAEAAKELRNQRFERAYERALSEGRIDAKGETKARLRKLFDLDEEALLEDLRTRPKILNTEANGHGKGKPEVPEGVDEERAELDQRVKAYMREHDCDDYAIALRKVLERDSEEAR